MKLVVGHGDYPDHYAVDHTDSVDHEFGRKPKHDIRLASTGQLLIAGLHNQHNYR